MNKTLMAAFAFGALVCNLSAQTFSSADQARMKEYGLVPGKVVTTKGDTLVGFLKKMQLPTADQLGYDPNQKGTTFIAGEIGPEFGEDIRFVSTEVFNAEGKIKRKSIVKYNPDNAKGYVYDYTGTNRHFLSVKIKTKSLIFKGQAFVELMDTLANGDVCCDIYNTVGAYSDVNPTYEEVEPYLHTYPGLLTSNTEAILILEQDPAEFYKTRCPEVAQKWTNNEYTQVTKKKGGALNGLAKFAAKVDSKHADEARTKAFNDYKKSCGAVAK